MNEENKMQKERSPNDVPEVYAQYYLLPEEDIAFFEKVKALHDYAQEKDLPFCALTKTPISGTYIGLYHLTNPCENKEEQNRKFYSSLYWLSEQMANLLFFLSAGKITINERRGTH